jgi:hypothetical protein
MRRYDDARARRGEQERREPVAVATRQTLTIHDYGMGRWTVSLIDSAGWHRGWDVSTDGLVALRDQGWALDDPKHLLDQYGPASLREDATSVAALDADSAGYGYRAGGPDSGDYGIVVADLEVEND